MTLTIEVPDDLAARLADLPAERQDAARADANRYAVASLAQAVENGDDLAPMTADEKADVYSSLAVSFAEADAGLLIPGDEVFARLEAKQAGRRKAATDAIAG